MKIHWPGLAGRLAIVTFLLVGFAVVAVSFYSIRTLRVLAAGEGLARVELAASAANEMIRQTTEDLVTAARVLGERPTLKRLLDGRNDPALAPYLSRYCEGAELDGCALVEDGEILLATGASLDWDRVLTAALEQGEQFLVTGALSGATVAGAIVSVDDNKAVRIMALREMGQDFVRRLSDRAGVDIGLVDYASFRPGEGPFAVLNSDALSRRAAVAGYVAALDTYVSAMPVASATGETVALLHALLPADTVMGPVDEMTRRILAVAALIAVLASTCGILIGRDWIAGVHRLTDSARRLGSGDLAASIPTGGGKELAVLGSTMEDMRRNLVDLTGELRRREAEAQAVLDGIVEGVYSVDLSRRIRFLNPTAESLLKVSGTEAIGRFCGDVLKPKRDAKGRRPCEHACPIVRARTAGITRAVEEIEPLSGRVRRIVISSSAPADNVQVQVLRDETELEAVRRSRDTVLANISHEFRTPLAAQLASIELLRDGLGRMTSQEQRELVFSLERGVVRLTWLIDNLLESVRIEADQLAIRRQDVRLSEVFQAARDLVEPLLGQRGQCLEVADLETLPVIRGDRQRLTQVIVNLLANASKFGPEGSTISAGGNGTGNGGLVFWIDDEGAGPDDPDDEYLFDRFRRNSGDDDVQESGLGLGLFIVRSIVERHGGRVRLLRTGEGRTRAEVNLPKGGAR